MGRELPEIELCSAEIENETLFISIKLTAKYALKVHSPRVTVCFKTADRTRLLPLPVRSCFRNEDGESSTVLAYYRYRLDCLFLDEDWKKPLFLSFSLLAGNEFFENIRITGHGEFSGSELYELSFDPDAFGQSGALRVDRRSFDSEKRPFLFLRFLQGLISLLYALFLRIFGLCLLPWLLFDALMVFFGFKKEGFVQKEERSTLRFFVDSVREGYRAAIRREIGRKDFKEKFVLVLSRLYGRAPVVKNRITFFSNRRADLSGNFEWIVGELEKNEALDIRLHLDPKPLHRMSLLSLLKFARLYATSAVSVVDDFYELMSVAEKKEGVKIVQVWHACGAFKTFGFSRIGRPGGPKQCNPNHRMYDRAIVSSDEIRRFYAEGFGIALDNVVATGVPRTDLFFSEEEKQKTREEFYLKFPKLRGKKIMLFAPTFRGNGRLSGYYPAERIDLKRLYEETGGEYAILIKMHPFITERAAIPEEYSDCIIDFSDESEINSLLFISDLLITDYSSVVFEASLLDLPMLFYAYDLQEYTASRDFYYEYEFFIPGKLTEDFASLIKAIKERDFEEEKIEPFKHKFFENLDGRSTERTARLIESLLEDKG